MLPDHVRRVWQVARDILPSLAEIFGGKNIGFKVIVTMAIEANIGASVPCIGTDYACDIGIGRNPGDTIDDILPGLAAIPRNLHVAVVGSDPDDTLLDRRFSDRHDLSVGGLAVMAREDIGLRHDS